MADDNIVRSYRSSGPARRAPETVVPRNSTRDDEATGEEIRSDPLAELARLIGQSDPFADLGQSTRYSQAAAPAAPPPPPDPAPASDWRATAAALARESLRSPPLADQHAEDTGSHLEKIHSAIADIDSYRVGPDDRFAQPAYPAGTDEPEAAEPYDEQPYFGHSAEDLRSHPHEGHAAEPNYFFDGEPATDERFYDDPPRARRGNSLVTAAVLIGCAMLGTAGAYGYRAYYAGARSTDAPIISADPTPNKVVPATASVAPQPGRPGQVADASASEQVVTHQEEPVALPSPSTPPRVVLPAPFASQTPPASTRPSAPAAPAAAPAKDPSEPKKVRTVAIRPDNPDAVARPLVTTPTSPSGPVQTSPVTPASTARAPAAAKPAPQSRNAGAPLPLEPRAEPTVPAAPDRTASTGNGPRLASVAPGASGSYVQLSSQRSEAEAQASFHSLQAKFPQQLGEREPLVRRADLGAKGIYYRAMVGPFGSPGEAEQFCSNLKAAGGQCIVQKN
jgi:SPOR domain